jgi:hypothetical protein
LKILSTKCAARRYIWKVLAREIEMGDREIRNALERHWAASDANDFAVEHEIYREDAVLHYPQSGERISRPTQYPREQNGAAEPEALRRPADRRQWRSLGQRNRDQRDGVPSYAVSIMEFSDGKVARETQYFGDPFKPGPSRAHLVDLNN